MNRQEEVKKMIAKIKAIQAENQDNRTKEVGDIVKVWDGSGNLDKNTGEKRYGIDKLFENEAIIIKTNCEVYSKRDDWELKRGFKPYLLDLLLKFPNGEEVYCSSEFVKRVDKNIV